MSKEAMKLALEALEAIAIHGDLACVVTPDGVFYLQPAITALREALAEQPAQKCSYPYCGCNSKAWCKVERNEALDKKAENARELGLDYEPAQQEPVAMREVLVRIAHFLGIVRIYAQDIKPKHELETDKPMHWKARELQGEVINLLDTTPPAQRTWAGLTTEDMATCINEPAWDLVLRKAEQILKEKNT